MKHYLIIQLLFLCTIAPAMAQYYSVNYDTRTVAEMSAAFGTEAATEADFAQQIAKIREHYQAAGGGGGGILSSKFLDRRALTNLGLWTSATENYYYRRIYNMVSAKIMPKIWTVAGMMLKSPHNALYWGSYLYKICDEVKTLCYQFESIVTNSTLSFKDIVFLEINQELAAILKLSELGNVDWNVLLDDQEVVPKAHVTTEDRVVLGVAGARQRRRLNRTERRICSELVELQGSDHQHAQRVILSRFVTLELDDGRRHNHFVHDRAQGVDHRHAHNVGGGVVHFTA